MMLELALDELTTEDQRRQAEFDLAQRIVKYGREVDRRTIERNRGILQEILNGNRQNETLLDVPEEPGASGEATGRGGQKAP